MLIKIVTMPVGSACTQEDGCQPKPQMTAGRTKCVQNWNDSHANPSCPQLFLNAGKIQTET